jgi:GMP synthase-like glutamine amidotransferase
LNALILQCCETEDLGLGKSCFGICCGAELLAIALGGEARASPVVEIGLTQLDLTRVGRIPVLDTVAVLR